MTRVTPLIALVLAGLLPLGCGLGGTADEAGTTDDAATLGGTLEARNDELLARLGRGDATGAAALYTADAVLLPPDGGVIRGRDDIRSFWAATVASTRILRAVSSAIDVQYDGGPLATVVGRYTLVTSTDGADPIENRGTTLLVWRRGQDGWRIHADMWTAEPAGS